MKILATLAVLLLLAGCAFHREEQVSWRDQTVLPKGVDVAMLNSVANNPNRSQAERATAVFTLFAHHIRLKSTATEIHKVLTDAAWLKESSFRGIRYLAGWVPVEMGTGDTVFCVSLFSAGDEKGWSPWAIYYRLSGQVRDEDGLAFLKGERTSDNPQLQEFALCFPEFSGTHNYLGRIERFSRHGIHVYPEGH